MPDRVQLNIPKQKDRKYFFGWHTVNGIPFAFKWAEEDGLPIGGHPNTVGEVLEISEEEWENAGVSDLEKEHPFKGDS